MQLGRGFMRGIGRLLGFSLLTACGASSLDGAVNPSERASARLAELVEDGLPGVQYVVVDDHGVVFEAALGVRDVESNEKMLPSTLQMAYSVTKVVTAVAAMQLVDQGKLELDRSLTTYYTEHPYGEGVTIRSLLAQTSGVPNPMPLDWFVVEGAALDRNAKLRALLSENAELEHEPGSAYAYSNLSYFLLEKAIERASGRDYAEYVAQHVFTPLSVTKGDATFELGDPGRSATGHSPRYSLSSLIVQWMAPSEYFIGSKDGWKRTARVTPYGRGYGGLFTNASSLGKLLSDLLREEPTVLTRRARDRMLTPQHTTDGETIPMTLGWVTGELDGARYFGKQGGGLGFHGNVRLYPDRKLATVLLANRTELTAGAIDARSDELDAIFVHARSRKEPLSRRTDSGRVSP
jgi:D-alanyl-D-alanine carboxypeptidase